MTMCVLVKLKMELGRLLANAVWKLRWIVVSHSKKWVKIKSNSRHERENSKIVERERKKNVRHFFYPHKRKEKWVYIVQVYWPSGRHLTGTYFACTQQNVDHAVVGGCWLYFHLLLLFFFVVDGSGGVFSALNRVFPKRQLKQLQQLSPLLSHSLSHVLTR